MGFFRLFFGQFWDEKGEFLKNVRFNKNNKTFSFSSKAYNIKLKDGSYFDKNGFLWDNRYYIYNKSCPDPILMDKKVQPQIDPEDYNTILETNHLKKLNDIGKENFLTNLLKDPKSLIIVAIFVVGLYLLLTGQLI